MLLLLKVEQIVLRKQVVFLPLEVEQVVVLERVRAQAVLLLSEVEQVCRLQDVKEQVVFLLEQGVGLVEVVEVANSCCIA